MFLGGRRRFREYGFGVWDLGFWVWGLGFGEEAVQGKGFRFWGEVRGRLDLK